MNEAVNNLENVRYLPKTRRLNYVVVECVRYFEASKASVFYGIKAMSGDVCVFYLEDISPDENLVHYLASLCNAHNVLPCHVQDLIDDLRVR